MRLLRRFHEHPASVGESYREHARHAVGFGWTMFRGSVACFVHAAFPWIHTTTGSRAVLRLHERMLINRSRARKDEMHTLDPLDHLAEHI